MGEIFQGDCRGILDLLYPDNYFDSVVTDPPYGLSKEPDIVEVLSKWLAGEDYEHTGGGFMGKSWDIFVPGPSVWREVYRVLKPGGYALVFAGTRTQDLITISLRLAGFEVRDVIEWLYFSGFPKSSNTHHTFRRRYECDIKNLTVNTAEPNSGLSGEAKEMDGLDSVPEVALELVNEEGLLKNVKIAVKGSTLLDLIKAAKAEGIKALFAITNVNLSGKNELQAKVILIGKAEDSPEVMGISLLTSAAGNIDLNTILSLKIRLGEESEKVKTFITLTELKMIIDLKILNCLPSVSTLNAILMMNHTALKPAHEPIIVVRKPLIGTVANNVEKYGTGGINIDGCRIGISESDREQINAKSTKDVEKRVASGAKKGEEIYGKYDDSLQYSRGAHESGRFPANCITTDADAFYSPYFNVTPQEISKKASKKDRNSDWRGEEIARDTKTTDDGRNKPIDNPFLRGETERVNTHPTVKPLDLMAWLVRLVTPPGGTTLDPFVGSGTTCAAAHREGFNFVGIEREGDFVEIAKARAL